jgi:MSHA pilin protein MshC
MQHIIYKNAVGVSLIELLVVMVLLSILTVIALPRLYNPAVFKEAGFHLDLLNALRYAQKTAIASGCEVQVSISAASGTYALNYRSGGTNTSCGSGSFVDLVPHPQAQGSFMGTASADVVLSNDLNVIFDSSGSPSSGGSLSVGSKVVTVEPVTGFVHD